VGIEAKDDLQKTDRLLMAAARSRVLKPCRLFDDMLGQVYGLGASVDITADDHDNV